MERVPKNLLFVFLVYLGMCGSDHISRKKAPFVYKINDLVDDELDVLKTKFHRPINLELTVATPLLKVGPLEKTFEVSNVTITGLVDKLWREDDVYCDKKNPAGGSANISGIFFWEELQFTFNYEVKRRLILHVDKHGTGTGSVTNLNVDVNAEVNFKDNSFELTSTIVNSFESVNVKTKKSLGLFLVNIKKAVTKLIPDILKSAHRKKVYY